MKTLTTLALVVLLAGCATAAAPKVEWRQLPDGAWVQIAPPPIQRPVWRKALCLETEGWQADNSSTWCQTLKIMSDGYRDTLMSLDSIKTK